MTGPRQRIPPAGWRWLLFGALGVCGAALALVRQLHFGPGLTPDSAAYLSVARAILAGDGFAPFFGDYRKYAPFFPLALSAVAPLAADVIRAAAVVNAAAFGGTVALTASWLHRRQAPLWLSLGAGLGAALSLPLANLAAHVWSEALFVLLIVASLTILDRYLLVGGRRLLIASALCAAMCFVTRYMGGAVVASGVVVLLVAAQGPSKAKISRALGYAAIAIAPVGLWTVRNWFTFGALVGDEYPRGFSALASFDAGVTQTLYGILGPVLFNQLIGAADAFGGGHQGGMGLKLALLAVCAGLLAWKARRRGRPHPLLVPGCFTIVYFAALAVALPLRELYAEPRFFAVGHASVLLVLALGLLAVSGDGAAASGTRRRSVAGVAAGIGVALWLAQWVNANRLDIGQWLARGSEGYGARRWHTSETVALLKGAALPTGIVLSNDPFALYLLAGADTRAMSRGQCPPASSCIRRLHAATLPRRVSKRRSSGESMHIVWFHRTPLWAATDLAGLVDAFPAMRVVAVLADGIVFRIGAGSAASDVADQVAKAMLRDAGPPLPAGGQPVGLDSQATPPYRLHLAGRRLTYVGLGCERGEARQRFYLHVVPRDSGVLPHAKKQHFENLDFNFAPRGLLHNGHCLLTAQLPDYAIAEVRTGQAKEGAAWSARFTPTLDRR